MSFNKNQITTLILLAILTLQFAHAFQQARVCRETPEGTTACYTNRNRNNNNNDNNNNGNNNNNTTARTCTENCLNLKLTMANNNNNGEYALFTSCTTPNATTSTTSANSTRDNENDNSSFTFQHQWIVEKRGVSRCLSKRDFNWLPEHIQQLIHTQVVRKCIELGCTLTVPTRSRHFGASCGNNGN